VGENFIEPKILIKLAEEHGWVAHKSKKGGSHTVMMKKPGKRKVPIRSTCKGKIEAQVILDELGIPRDKWPDKVR
jgi:predicted RNA binding protein YcfA (HicA-like mRNA interferase family)